MISINSATKLKVKKKVVKKTLGGTKKKGAVATKRAAVPPLRPSSLTSADAISAISSLPASELEMKVENIFGLMIGNQVSLFGAKNGIATPRVASTSMDRSGAAADLATLCKELGAVTVLKKYGVLEKLEAQLVPNGIGAVFGNANGLNPGGGMKKILSTLSLASMASTEAETFDGGSTIMSDSKKGRTTSPDAREGCLLFLRALAEIVGETSEPFIIPLLAAALEECSSSSSYVRSAAEDTASTIVKMANPHVVSLLIFPVLFEALHSPEWRVKTAALEKLAQCADAYPRPTSLMLPKIIPTVTGQVWDTKPQVTKAAKATLLACCKTNINPDVAPAIPAIVNAICKPTETVKAIDELKATTFVASVDASTLSILCPVLSRGLKDKMALNKRSCCVVVENMSRLVETPSAVAPFGPLLVPELKKVAENVQFDEIRDAALAALGALSKALGHSNIDDALSSIMKEENDRIEAEWQRIEDERAAEAKREEEMAIKEAEERKLWREAMEAQRQLDQLALHEEEQKRAAAAKEKEQQKKSAKGKTGKCQGCGLKKCKQFCLFAN